MSGMAMRGSRMNYYWNTEGARTQHERPWSKLNMDISVGERTLIYSAVDANNPEKNSYKLYVRFTEELPVADE